MANKITKRIHDSINVSSACDSMNKWQELSANYDEEHMVALNTFKQ